MANPTQLAGQIRYYLGELSTRSGHHEFEELARSTARARLYRKILPATGPVSSGGDERGGDVGSQQFHAAFPTPNRPLAP